ncbi:MAG: phosphatase PAP2 family protein [Candidatus Moranbacteria bacterium]|nr:phosphatase PAP2 family protein [Candidatus Moranbacteria bacterium]
MDFLLSLLPSISRIGAFGYVAAFLLALSESLPFIGLVFPGTVFILILGFFASQGYLHFGTLVWAVAVGAFVGDGIGYLLGTKGTELFRNGNRILRLSHLRKGERYFERHGAFSVFLGRFSGSLRPIIPFVVGRAGLRRSSYVFRSVFAALVWSWMSLTAGYLFGGAVTALGTWFTRVSVVILFLAVLSSFLWIVSERAHPFLRVLRSIAHAVHLAIREDPGVRGFLDRYPSVALLLHRRLNRRDFSGLPLTLFVPIVGYVIFLLYGTVDGILSAEPILSVDARILNLMYAFRDPGFVRGFLWITLLGRRDIILVVMLSASAFFVLFRYRKLIVPLWLVMGGTQLCVTLGKRLLERPRPELAYYTEPSFSFPSGHAALATALYGFLAYAFLRGRAKRWRYRTVALFLMLVLVASVGLSRLYLGVHFFSDVWGGHLLGALWVLIGISVAELEPARRQNAGRTARPEASLLRRFNAAGALLFVVTFYVYQGVRYEPIRNFVETEPNPVIESDDIVRSFGEAGLPRFSETFSGAHQEPMNVIVIVRDEATFVTVMERAGWLRSDPVTVPNMAKLTEASFLKRSYPRAPMTPSFWNTNVHDPGFQKETDKGTVHARHHARFWKAPVRSVDGESVYVGTASLDTGIKWIVTHRINPDIDTERETLFKDLVATGAVVLSEKIRFVDPVLGKNFSGDPFFTDGEAYVLRFD